MTSRLAVLFATLCLLAAPAQAQPIGNGVTSDLDGDGYAERFDLYDSGYDSAELRIETRPGHILRSTGIVWMGGIGQQPELGLAPNGSVQVIAMNEAIGRNRWHQTLTIAFRNGTYRVVGYTYDWYDTLDLSANGTCDLNLLNGRGTLSRYGGPARAIRHDWNPLPVTEWNSNIAPPDVCGVY